MRSGTPTPHRGHPPCVVSCPRQVTQTVMLALVATAAASSLRQECSACLTFDLVEASRNSHNVKVS